MTNLHLYHVFLTSFVRFGVSGATLAMAASATFLIKTLAEGVRLSVPCVRARYPIRLCTSRSRGRMLARTRLATVEVDLKAFAITKESGLCVESRIFEHHLN